MAKVEIYAKTWCPYCKAAVRLLKSKNVDYQLIDITHGARRQEQEMQQRSGRTSVPQIFVNDRHLGGYDDLAELDQAGELDPLLGKVHARNTHA